MNATTPSYVLKLGLDTTAGNRKMFVADFNLAFHVTNVMVKEGQRRLDQLNENHYYLYLCGRLTRLKASKIRNAKTDKDKTVNKRIDKECESIRTKLSDIRMAYGLSRTDFEKYLHRQYEMYKDHLDSTTIQKIADKEWTAAQGVLFGKGKRLHYKKKYEVNSFEAKSNGSGIRYKDHKVYVSGMEIPVIIKPNDEYVQECLDCNRIKYCRIKREWHKGKYKYYVELVMEGIPPLKGRRYGKEVVGIDIGPSTIAVVSDSAVMLQELCGEVDKIDQQIRVLNRKMDRSRRSTNPQNFNTDGTIKNGIIVNGHREHLSWNYSKAYLKARDQRKELYALRHAQIVQTYNQLANQILSLGSTIIIEDMNWAALQKRSSKTEISEKTGRYKKKKRFGKSILNHAPSLLMNIIDRKLGYVGKAMERVECRSTKATKFNHSTGEYEEVGLNDRWVVMMNGDQIQRDLHSAFNLKHVCQDSKGNYLYDCYQMNRAYDSFKQMHDECIKTLRQLKSQGKSFSQCMGI